MEEVIQVEHLDKRFPIGANTAIAAVRDVSFAIGKGETLGLVGESGSGKTTVGRCVLRLIEPSGGRIMFEGFDLASMSLRELRRLRPRMQMVFQDAQAALNPKWTVASLVEEPLTLTGGLDAPGRRRVVSEVMASVRLSTTALSLYPFQLTQGEQQRVGIARALVSRPSLIVLDEPTSSLDPSVRAEILDVLRNLQRQFSVSFLFISHDLTAVEALAHRIAVMYLGCIVEMAPMEELRARQYHPYSRALLSAVLYPDPTIRPERFYLSGEIPTAINPPDECPLVSRCPFVLAECRSRIPPLAPMVDGRLVACVRALEFARSGFPEAAGEHRGST
jgi:peptide/nickel transport system ATP-binding protein